MIRNHVREVAETLGYSMADVIKGAGVPKTSMVRIWNNESQQISLETLDKLCSFLKVPVGELYEFVPDDQMTPEDYEHLEQRRKGVEKFNSWRKSKKKQ